jgi:hypothetical protein
MKRLVIAGGVSANRHLRETLEAMATSDNATLYYARPAFCTDNGAMIAYAGYHQPDRLHRRLDKDKFQNAPTQRFQQMKTTQLAEYSWSHFGYSPIITRGSPAKAQLVTLLILSTHNPWINW